jgi:hypothetical protein
LTSSEQKSIYELPEGDLFSTQSTISTPAFGQQCDLHSCLVSRARAIREEKAKQKTIPAAALKVTSVPFAGIGHLHLLTRHIHKPLRQKQALAEGAG